MKNIIWIIALVVLTVLSVLEFRYALIVNSPIVAKIDRITGDVWIANSGTWRKVQHAPKEGAVAASATIAKKTEKAAQVKAK